MQEKTLCGPGIAYTQANRIIKEAEKGLGFKIFSLPGSKNSGTAVTKEAKELAEKYEAFREACEQSFEELLSIHFGK